MLLEKEPNNLQALSLAELVEKKMTRGTPLVSVRLLTVTNLIDTEGYIGLGLAAGAAALGTLLLAGLVRRANRH